VIGLDTNVLLRFLVDDDPTQNEMARRFLSARTIGDPVFISAVTIAETVWVLTRTLDYSVDVVCGMLRDLLASDAVSIEHGDELGFLLGESLPKKAEIADYLIAWSAERAGCSHTVTLDRRAARLVPAMELLA
jgi:predicted nucleic-acid-binding protein